MKRMVFLLVLSFLAGMSFATDRISVFGISIDASQDREHDSQFPDRDDYVYGWRGALFSGAHRRMVGLSTAVFANNDDSAQGVVGGLQTAILFNTAASCEMGAWQISGFCNWVSDGGNGLQLSVTCNRVGVYFNGLQIGLYNEVKHDFAGVQVGLVNQGGDVWGVQIGLDNFAKSLHGIQIGVLNLVKDSQMTVFPVIRLGW